MRTFLEFEKPIAELETKIEELRQLTDQDDLNISEEIAKLESKAEKLLYKTYSKLLPVQKVQIARHPYRPHFKDYLTELIDGFIPLAGDRKFAEDRAIVCGIGRFCGYSVLVMGQEKGGDTDSRIYHNFGMPRPEGYRKAQRLMEFAEHFELPVLTFIDTAGAYPGIGAEQRGQAQAIACCIESCLGLKVPILSIIIGEGGSGGAIALGVSDRILMLEHAIYSVISPEGCASILWRDRGYMQDAAAALKLTAQDLKKLGIVDEVIPEPLGGAHRHPQAMITALKSFLEQAFFSIIDQPPDLLQQERHEKFLAIGRLT